MSLLNIRNELRMKKWVPWIPRQFLLHVCVVLYICKQLGLEANFKEAMSVLKLNNSMQILQAGMLNYLNLQSRRRVITKESWRY